MDKVIVSSDDNIYPIWKLNIIQYNAGDILNKIG